MRFLGIVNTKDFPVFKKEHGMEFSQTEQKIV